MWRPIRPRARRQFRHVAVAATIAIGVLASVATSSMTATGHATPWFAMEAADLEEEVEERVRLCAEGELRAGEPVTYEFAARAEGLPPAAATIPVTLSIEGDAETGRLNLQWPSETRRLELSVIPDSDDVSSRCSPWASVIIGPAAGEVDGAVVQWQLKIFAEIPPRSTSRLEFGGD